MIDTLPSDIIVEIARWLPQNDLLCFAFTCKKIYGLAHSQIYSAVTIDSTKRVYNQENLTEVAPSNTRKTEYAFEPVIIRSLFALTRFLKTLVAHPEYGTFIQALVAQDQFPDISNFELNKLLEKVFPYLTNLKVLHWYSVNCPLEAKVLSLLPHPELLRSLCGNFHKLDHGMPRFSSPALRFIDFSNFAVSDSIRNMDFATFPNLESLTLARKASTGGPLFSSKVSKYCQNFIEDRAESLSSYSSLAKSPMYISNLFSVSCKTPLRLHTLVLRDICVTTEDARILLANIDCSFLNHLSLGNCFENLFGNLLDQGPDLANQIHITRRTPPPETFLDALSNGLTSLHSLHIGISNEMCYNAATFNFISKLRGLSKLSVNIKNFSTRGPINLAPFIISLQTHKDTLKYLNICTNVVSQIASPTCPRKSNYYKLESIIDLATFHQLKVLRLPVTYSQIQELPELFSGLKNIRIIQLLVNDLSSTAVSSSCNGCVNSLNSAICATNSLIAQDYFQCPSPFAKTFEEEQNQNYHDFATKFKKSLPSLKYLRFDTTNRSFVYKCEPSAIQLKDSIYSAKFDILVNQHLGN